MPEENFLEKKLYRNKYMGAVEERR